MKNEVRTTPINAVNRVHCMQPNKKQEQQTPNQKGESLRHQQRNNTISILCVIYLDSDFCHRRQPRCVVHRCIFFPFNNMI